jgi:hypothetical protein
VRGRGSDRDSDGGSDGERSSGGRMRRKLVEGPSSGKAHDLAVQRAAAKDDAGASLEPKHGHARGTGTVS